MGSSVLTQHVHMEKHLGVWRAEFIKIGLQWSLMAPHLRQAGRTISSGTSLSFTAVDPVPPSARVITPQEPCKHSDRPSCSADLSQRKTPSRC